MSPQTGTTANAMHHQMPNCKFNVKRLKKNEKTKKKDSCDRMSGVQLPWSNHHHHHRPLYHMPQVGKVCQTHIIKWCITRALGKVRKKKHTYTVEEKNFNLSRFEYLSSIVNSSAKVHTSIRIYQSVVAKSFFLCLASSIHMCHWKIKVECSRCFFFICARSLSSH